MSTGTLLLFFSFGHILDVSLLFFAVHTHTIRNRFLRRIHVRTHGCFVTRADDDQCNVAVTPFSAVMILVTRSHEVDYITERLSGCCVVVALSAMAPPCPTYLLAWIHDNQVDATFVANDTIFLLLFTSLYQRRIHLVVHFPAYSTSKRVHRHSGLRSTSVQYPHHPMGPHFSPE